MALLNKSNLLGQVRFAANARANLLTDEVVSLLKEMNVVSVGMGLESGSQRILHYLKGTSISIEDNYNAVKMLKKYKIAANASFVIGSPDETKEEILETLRFIKKSGLDLVDTYVLTPFPGTPIWTYAKEKGLVSDDMDWDKLNVMFATNSEKAIILSQTLSRKQLSSLFTKFRRLSLFLAAKNVLGHPFLTDVPKILINKIVEKLNRLWIKN